jgi:hypothetical protein
MTHPKYEAVLTGSLVTELRHVFATSVPKACYLRRGSGKGTISHVGRSRYENPLHRYGLGAVCIHDQCCLQVWQKQTGPVAIQKGNPLDLWAPLMCLYRCLVDFLGPRSQLRQDTHLNSVHPFFAVKERLYNETTQLYNVSQRGPRS